MHVAYYQAQVAAVDILGMEHEPADYTAVPCVTSTDPDVAGVGLTEAGEGGPAAGALVGQGMAAWRRRRSRHHESGGRRQQRDARERFCHGTGQW